jgi:hypothetical protein
MAIVKLIDTPNDPVRLAFLHVFTKRPGMQRDDGSTGEAKFEVTPILKPGGDNEKRVNVAIEAVAKEKYGEKMVKDDDGNPAPNWKVVLAGLDEDRKGLRSGNKKRDKGGNIFDGFEGMKYITARTVKRPTVVNRDRSILVEEDGIIYSGCFGSVNIDIWALKKQGVKPCIVADLLGVQFTRDGDAFGGGAAPSSPDDFADLGADEDADASSLMDE